MVKFGLKFYLKSFRYFFVPIGALALGIVFGLSIAVPMILGAVNTFISGLAKTVGSISVNWDAVQNTLLTAFYKFDWTNPQIVFNQISTQGYWSELLRNCADAAIGDVTEITAQIDALFKQALTTITTGAALGVVFTILGGLTGYFVTGSIIRNDVAKRSFFKTLFPKLIGSLVNTIILSVCVFLISKINKYAALQVILFLLLYVITSFVKAYFIYGYKKISFKKVLNIKNINSLLLLSAIEIIIMFAIVLILHSVFNIVLLLLIGYSVFVITLCCIKLNDEAYVKRLAEKESAAHKANSNETNSLQTADAAVVADNGSVALPTEDTFTKTETEQTGSTQAEELPEAPNQSSAPTETK